MGNILLKMSKTLPIDNTAIDFSSLPDNSKYRPKNIPIEKIIDLRKRGLSYSQMGKVLGVSKVACLKRLQAMQEHVEAADAFKRNKSEVFNLKQSMMLSSINESAIKEMQPYQRVVAASILYDKQRLEDNQSTSNQSVTVRLINEIKQLDAGIDNEEKYEVIPI